MHNAFFVFFAVTVIYLSPAFLGKVDTPVDIRDMRMYPWRYYGVDKKVKHYTLWQGKFNEGDKVFYYSLPPQTKSTINFDIKVDDLHLKDLRKLEDSNYYVTFDFKPLYDSSVDFSFGISLVDKFTGLSYTPGVAVAPLAVEDKNKKVSWYRTQFPLNSLIYKLKKVSDLNHFSIELAARNKSKVSNASLYLKEIKIALEDFSEITKAHNHYNNDLIQMFAPFREYFSKSIKQFKLPFWYNYIFCGHEFLADPQLGYFHPLYFLLYFFFDHFTAHIMLTFICFLLSGIGAYLLASFWGLGAGASILAGIVYMFQPFNVTWFSYEHMLMNSASLPFLLLFYEKSSREKQLINKYLLISTFLLGLVLISGHLQYVYYSVVFFLMFSVYKLSLSLFFRNGDKVKIFFSTMFILLFGFMISAVVLLPFLTLLKNSHRVSNPIDLIKETSVPLKAFLGLFYPYYMDKPDWTLSGIISKTPEYEEYRQAFMRNYVYFGLLPFLISLFSIKLFFKRSIAFFLFVSVFISILICTGSPLFFLIRDFLPGFKEMQHYRFLQIFSYSVPFICGIGFQVLMDLFSKLSKRVVGYISTGVILVSVIDLMYFSSFFVTWSDRKDYAPIHKGGVLEFILKEKEKSKEPFRVLPFTSQKVEGTFLRPDIAEPNTLLPYEIEDVSGYSSFISKDFYYALVYIQTMDSDRLYSGRIFDLFSNINTPYPISNFHSRILDLLNVKYFIVPNFLTLESDKVKKIFSGDCTVYENLDYLPRAFFVEDYKVIESPKETIIALDSDEFNPRREVILMTHIKEVTSSLRAERSEAWQSPTNSLEILRSAQDNASHWIATSGLRPPRNDSSVIDFLKYEQSNITLKAIVEHAGFLVLGHNLNDNWKVKINNKEGKHYSANLIQRAVYLPREGEYVVEFYYFPKLFLKGLLISLTSLFFILVLFLVSLVRAKNQ